MGIDPVKYDCATGLRIFRSLTDNAESCITHKCAYAGQRAVGGKELQRMKVAERERAMRQEKLDDFQRVLRTFCRQHGLDLDERTGRGPHKTYVLYRSISGNRQKIATCVVRADRKEIPQHAMRRILDAFYKQLGNILAHNAADELSEILQQLIKLLERWLQH